ncbi:hypothetical protein C6P44_000989, partial [Monosporozyma unispora]
MNQNNNVNTGESQQQLPYGAPSGMYNQNGFSRGLGSNSMGGLPTNSPMYGPNNANHIGNMGHGFIDISTTDLNAGVASN